MRYTERSVTIFKTSLYIYIYIYKKEKRREAAGIGLFYKVSWERKYLLIDFPFSNFCLLVLETDAAFELLSSWRRGSTYKTSPFRCHPLVLSPVSPGNPLVPGSSGPLRARYPPRSVQPANVFLLFIPSHPLSPSPHPTHPHFLFLLSARRRHDECHICRFIFVYGCGIQFCGGVRIIGFLNGCANIIWTDKKFITPS